jgi:hypothetical protein
VDQLLLYHQAVGEFAVDNGAAAVLGVSSSKMTPNRVMQLALRQETVEGLHIGSCRVAAADLVAKPERHAGERDSQAAIKQYLPSDQGSLQAQEERHTRIEPGQRLPSPRNGRYAL